jgi:5-oxoprolinase (ATP-hydrolysing)
MIIHIAPGSLLLPTKKFDVVGGNVFTSHLVTNVVLTTFQTCAFSQGCINKLTFGDNTFGNYETIGGGCGVGPGWNGTTQVQCHMKNTHITDSKILEQWCPVLRHRIGLGDNSGGAS